MPISVKNLDFIRQYPEIGTKLAEALQQIADAHNQVEQQGNFNSTGQPKAPPPVQGLMVQASNGHFQVAIDHNVDRYRGVNYFVEHADNPNFTDSHTEEMGASRNANLFLGDSTRYFRAYAAYPGSAPGDPAYHGSFAEPMPVSGGGSVPGPSFLPSRGSGTGLPGQGMSGPGPIPFVSQNGVPPIRK